MRLLSFVKNLFLQIALLLNCRNNVYIPQFLRRNWHSTGSLVVSTLECDARMPRFKPWPRHYNFPKFLYFSSCFDTFDFKYIFFLSIYFSCFNIYKNKTISIVYCEAFGVKCSEYFFEPSPNELAALSWSIGRGPKAQGRGC